MICSKSDPALLMVCSGLFTGAEVLHGEKKQVLVLLPRGFICSGVQQLVAVLSTRLQCHTSVGMLEWERNVFTSHCYQGTQRNLALRTREREHKTSVTQHCHLCHWAYRKEVICKCVGLQNLSPLLDRDCGLLSGRGSRQFQVVLHKCQLASVI